MDSRGIIHLLLIFLILIIGVGLVNGDISPGSSGTPVSGELICTTDVSGNKNCITEESIPELAQNFEEFNKLYEKAPKFADYILKEHFDKFKGGFVKATLEEQAKFFLKVKEEDNTHLLTKEQKTELIQSLDRERQGELLIKFINERMKKLYGKFEATGEYPQVKSVNIVDSGKTLIIDGFKIIGKNGGYLNLEKEPDMIDSRITKIDYKDGDFIVDYGKDAKIKLQYSQGTPSNKGFLKPDGKVLGGDKDLSFLYVKPKENLERNIRISFNEHGAAEIRLSGAVKQTGIRIMDINGNNVFISLNEDNAGQAGAKPGEIAERLSTVVYIGKMPGKNSELIGDENTIWAKSAEIKTSGYGNYKISNSDFTALTGDVFEKPGAGVKKLESTITELVLPEVLKGALEGASNTLKSSFQGLQDALEYVGESGVESFNDFMSGSSTPVSDPKSAPPLEAEGSIAGTILTETVVSATKGGGEGFKEGFESTLKELSHPSYEKYEEAGMNYLYLSDKLNQVRGGHFREVRVGGGYMLIDLTNVKGGGIDVVSADNYGDASKGETIHVLNGEYLTSFKMENTYNKRVKGYHYNNAIPVGFIINKQGIKKNNPNSVFSLQRSSGHGFQMYDINTRLRDFGAQSQYVQGPLGTQYYVGGLRIKNAPLAKSVYPGDFPDAKVKIAISPYLASSTLFGSRRMIVGKIGEQAAQTTNSIAGKFADATIESLNKQITAAGGISAFEKQMERLNTIVNSPDYNPEEIIPGYNNNIRDMVYFWNNPDKYDETIRNFAKAGVVRTGYPVELTMNNGMYYAGRKIPGTDPTITRLLASDIIANPPPNLPTKSLLGSKGEGAGPGYETNPPKSLKKYVEDLRNSAK